MTLSIIVRVTAILPWLTAGASILGGAGQFASGLGLGGPNINRRLGQATGYEALSQMRDPYGARVASARRHGLHPLFALGAGGAGFPSVTIPGRPSTRDYASMGAGTQAITDATVDLLRSQKRQTDVEADKTRTEIDQAKQRLLIDQAAEAEVTALGPPPKKTHWTPYGPLPTKSGWSDAEEIERTHGGAAGEIYGAARTIDEVRRWLNKWPLRWRTWSGVRR